MRGIATLEARAASGADVPEVVLAIASAGFGLVGAKDVVPPYDVTFAGMPKGDLRTWADHLGLPRDVRDALAQPADLHLVLLGDDYAEAARLDQIPTVGGPALWLTSAKLAETLTPPPDVRLVPLSRQTPRAFGTNLIGVRGEIAGRLLVALADDPDLLDRLLDPDFDLLAFLARRPKVSDPAVDWIGVDAAPPPGSRSASATSSRTGTTSSTPTSISSRRPTAAAAGGGTARSTRTRSSSAPPTTASSSLGRSSGRAARSGGTSRGSSATAASTATSASRNASPCWATAARSATRRRTSRRTPPTTCSTTTSAWGSTTGSPSTTSSRWRPTTSGRQFRYDLTLANAEAFLMAHRAQGLAFRPIGAVQGWDLHSYREAARQTVAMGYDYIAVGGLVQARTAEVLAVLEAVHEVVPPSVQVHAFGLARLEATADLVRLGGHLHRQRLPATEGVARQRQQLLDPRRRDVRRHPHPGAA